MSVKLRLVLSYIAMLIIPVILSSIAAVVIGVMSVNSIKKEGVSWSESKIGADTVLETAAAMEDIKNTAASTPDKLMDTAYLDSLNSRLSAVNIGLVSRKGDKVIYKSEIFKNIDIERSLTPFGGQGKYGRYDEKNGTDGSFAGNSFLSIKQHDFYFSDGQQGSVFLMADIRPLSLFVSKFTGKMMVTVLIILIFTNGILTYMVSKSIIKPLNALKKAAEQIREGNLNFEVKPKSTDEIGQLAVAFEEMRKQLKYSIDKQLQYENNRTELIANISHDLKTPITSIKGYVEGIMDGVPDSGEKMDKYVRTIYSKANDMDRLIDELFLYSKLDLNKLPFNFENMDITSYLKDCADEYSFDLEQNNIKLTYNGGDTSVEVIGDREKLKRVITNIIENAVKYMDKENGTIDISTGDLNEEALICIQDNGRGIPQDILPMIFDRFYRGDPARGSVTGGSGLGLAISKMIIEGHGGRIWAESTEGSGTKICFTIKKIDGSRRGGSDEKDIDNRG